MENHPIPQDVTGFQFRLIGDMTVKQFGYVGVGFVFATLFIFVFPLPFLVKLPLAILCGGSGLALAFVPLEGRAMDIMAYNFTKALFAPNQYLYKKLGGQFLPELSTHVKIHVAQSSSTPKAQNLEQFLQTLHQQQPNKLDKKEQQFINSLAAQPLVPPIAIHPVMVQQQTTNIPPQPLTPQTTAQTFLLQTTGGNHPGIAPVQQPQQQKNNDEEKKLQKEVAILKKELDQAKNAESQQQMTHQAETSMHQKTVELEQFLQEALAQKQQLESQLLTLKKTMEEKQQAYTPGTMQAQQVTQNVKKIATKADAKVVGAPLVPEVPNLITGVIKDPRGNFLPNILIEIKNREGNPVRAFKTNQVGQFASATALQNGIYTVEFEDPKNVHKFDMVELTVDGSIIFPLEVISIDAREELRRTLFA